MTQTGTRTSTFNISQARYVTSKLMTDLRLLQGAYGEPSDGDIVDYGEEAALLLRDGLLGEVTYGFLRAGNWVVALRYVARTDGTLQSDDRAGRIPRRVDVSGARFYSYLSYSAGWNLLSWFQQKQVQEALPIDRVTAAQPGTSGGLWISDKAYSSNGSGVGRSTFRPLL